MLVIASAIRDSRVGDRRLADGVIFFQRVGVHRVEMGEGALKSPRKDEVDVVDDVPSSIPAHPMQVELSVLDAQFHFMHLQANRCHQATISSTCRGGCFGARLGSTC